MYSIFTYIYTYTLLTYLYKKSWLAAVFCELQMSNGLSGKASNESLQ